MSLFNSRLDRENVPAMTQLVQVEAPPAPANGWEADLALLEQSELGEWLARLEGLDPQPNHRYSKLKALSEIRAVARGLLEAEADHADRPPALLRALDELLIEHMALCITWPSRQNEQATEPVPAAAIRATVLNQHLVPKVGLDILLQLRYYVGRTGWVRRCEACGSAFLVIRPKQQFCSHRCSIRVSARRRRSEEKRSGVVDSNPYFAV